MPEAASSFLHRLLHLPFLPAGRPVTELRFLQVMTDHRLEALFDLALLAAVNFVDRGLHVIVDTPLLDTTESVERMEARIE